MKDTIAKAVDALGGQTKAARLLRVTQGAVWQWINGHKPLPARRAVELEHLTAGAIRADQLCDGFEFERDAQGAVVGYRVRVAPPAPRAEAA